MEHVGDSTLQLKCHEARDWSTHGDCHTVADLVFSPSLTTYSFHISQLEAKAHTNTEHHHFQNSCNRAANRLTSCATL